MNKINIQFPEKLIPYINSDCRYNVLYGGRGGAKSYNICLILLIRAMKEPLRILCCREFMSSMKDSVHRLLSDLIETYKLPGFTLTKTEISHENGSLFIFKGLKNNINEVKSTQGINICFVEEAQAVSEESWQILIPTIREEGSQFFIAFNPLDEEDPTYKRFVINSPPNAFVTKINYFDNPFFPDVLRKEMEYDKKTDKEKYLHIWEGKCAVTTSGTPVYGDLFNKHLHLIEEFPYLPNEPLILGFDFGETRSGWIVAQEEPSSHRLIILGSSLGIDLKTDKLADDCLHWVAANIGEYTGIITYCDTQGRVGTSNASKTDYDWLRTKGLFPKEDQHKGLIVDGINVVRKKISTITNGLPELQIVNNDQNKFLIKGFMGKYVWQEVSKTTGEVKRKPKHDDYSHPMDALRYICVNRYSVKTKTDIKKIQMKLQDYHNNNNMIFGP